MLKTTLAVCAALIFMLYGVSALAVSDADIEMLRAEIRDMKKTYESRIAELQEKLEKLELSDRKPDSSVSATPATARREVADNRFNPSIGVILNGRYHRFSSDEGEIARFAIGEEGERPREGFSVDHTELNFSASVDDKFFGSVTAAIAEHEGATEVELEEAYIQTLPGVALPDGMSVKAGRAFWTLGYLNEHHSHVDDFADRPLPYRVFLDEAYNDDGVQVSYVLATDLYTEIGAGAFRGDDFPFGESDGKGVDAWSAFARVGGDIGDRQSWRLGAYALSGKATGGRASHEGEVSFVGDTDLYALDFRHVWVPTGNAREREVILQGEYFWREEDGAYLETAVSEEEVGFDDSSSGWYAQAVYKFDPQWRVGARFSLLDSASAPDALLGGVLDDNGRDAKAYAAMVDWTNSEFSRVRLQYNREELARGQNDNQFMLQYIMSLGAHGAHQY